MKPGPTHGNVLSEARQEALFSDLLGAIRACSIMYSRPTFGAPWSARLEGAATHFHYVTSGACWLQVRGMPEATRVNQGDFVVIPRGRQHVICDSLGSPPVDYFELLNAHGADASGAFRAGGGGAVTGFLCGALQLESGPGNMLLSVLPLLIHVRGQAGGGPLWLEATVAHLLEELQNRRAYRGPVVRRLAELLLIQAVRAYLNESAHQVQTGWLAALRDRRVGQGLALMHSQPEEPWTVASLASRLSVSRSAFAERFSQLLGESPHRYLARLRLNLASERLRMTDDKIASIAASAGYKSLSAFSKAFKQELGASPVEYRRMSRLRQGN